MIHMALCLKLFGIYHTAAEKNRKHFLQKTLVEVEKLKGFEDGVKTLKGTVVPFLKVFEISQDSSIISLYTSPERT